MPTPYLSRATSENSTAPSGTPLPTSAPSNEAGFPIDWNANVVNFISNCRHPGLVRRTSLAAAHAPDGSTYRTKTHRRNLSAVTTIGFTRHPDTPMVYVKPSQHVSNLYSQANNFNSFRKRSAIVPTTTFYGHTRNISDPTSCWKKYPIDVKRTYFFEYPVYPLLSLSRQMSTTSPDQADGLSISDDLKSQASPYLPSWHVAYPGWEEVEEVEDVKDFGPDDTLGTRADERCFSSCLQPCATPLGVLLGLSFIMFVQTMVTSGLISSMLTTLEQRFNFTSRQVGYMLSCFEGSGVITTIAVSFINGRKHNRLRVVGLATLLISFGFALFTVPHFLVGPYEPELPTGVSNSVSNMSIQRGSGSPTQHSAHNRTINNVSVHCQPGALVGQAQTTIPRLVDHSHSRPDYSFKLLIFCIAMVLAGVGSSPINVLAPTYLWDNLSAKHYPIYSALFYSAGGLGPACGFLTGAGFLSVFIDSPFLSPRPGFTRNDPLWLGNWWLGILICAAVTFIAAFLVIAFPKRLPTKSTSCRTREDDGNIQPKRSGSSRIDVDETDRQSARHFPWNTDSKVHRPCVLRTQSGQICPSDHRATSESALPAPSGQSKNLLKGNAQLSDLPRAASVGCYPGKMTDIESRPVPLVNLPNKAKERLKAYFLVLRRVLTNPIWFGVTFASILEHSVVAAFITFVSKYIQGLFQVPAYLASIHTGAVVVPSSLVGVISGALFMRHYRPRIDYALAGMSAAIGATVITTISLMMIGCPDNRVAGVTATYDGRPWPWAYGPGLLMSPNLTAPCNVDHSAFIEDHLPEKFQCSSKYFDPVCWQRFDSGESQSPKYMTFFNPCFAGCRSQTPLMISSALETFSNCTCVTAHSLNPLGLSSELLDGSRSNGRVTVGRCPSHCPQYAVFLAILFIHVLLTGALQNPSNVVTLSCVAPEDSSVALGLQVFLMRTLAYIPAPIYFGQLFDLVCQYRINPAESASTLQPQSASDRCVVSTVSSASVTRFSSSTQARACLQYNLEGLPLVWLGLVLALKLVSFMASTVTWHVARRQMLRSQKPPIVQSAVGSFSVVKTSTTGPQSLSNLHRPVSETVPDMVLNTQQAELSRKDSIA